MPDSIDFGPDVASRQDVWLVYDGYCPYSCLTSHIIRIQSDIGKLMLIDVRVSTNHPVVRDLMRSGFDLNRGPVVRFDHRFYHARDALQLLAKLGSPQGPVSRLHIRLLRSRVIAGAVANGASMLRSLCLWLSGRPKLSPPAGF